MSEQIIHVQPQIPSGQQQVPNHYNVQREQTSNQDQGKHYLIQSNGTQQIEKTDQLQQIGHENQNNIPNSKQTNFGEPPPNYEPSEYFDPTVPHGDNTQAIQIPQLVGCPPGLEYLTQIDQLLIHQKIEMIEVLSSYETNNRYVIKNILGQEVYYAKEDTDCFIRNVCGPSRPFVIHVLDNLGQEVIQIRRPYACNCFGQCFSCLNCCQDEIEVEAPPNQIVGYVKQLYEGCEVRYAILNENRETVLRLHGPSYFHCYCPGDDYPLALLSADGSSIVGKVSKQWSNLVKELFTDADNFGIQFPMDLDVKVKAVIIGSVFLLDFMYFEMKSRNHRH